MWDTGNDGKFLDLVLNTKIYEAERSGISVDVRFDNMEGLILKETEVSIYGKRVSSAFIVNISNPAENMLIQNGNRLMTTKENKALHGHGLASITRVVEEYQGYVKYQINDKIFCLTIYLMGFQ